ncbi:MAG TPA: carbamoyltransferase N-terminal domain-containing protein, partial [Pirellulales bacterium]
MKRFILGLHSGHNASACIGDESGLLFAIQEERLTGEKNYWGTPKNAIRACMSRVNAAPRDLIAVAHGSVQAFCAYHSRDDVLRAYSRQKSLLGKFRQRIAVPLFIKFRPNWGQERLASDLAEVGLGEVERTHHDHHWGHAATAYYGLRSNPDEKCLVLTCDGDGDGLCTSVRVMGGGEDRLIAATPWDNSLGALYSWITFGMGFVPLEHEYKLMGMAPYASDKAAAEMAKIFARYLGFDSTGLQFERHTFRRTNDLAESLFRDLKGKRFDYICAGLQRFTEDMLCQWTANAVRATGVRKVLAAGGVFMNVKANKRIGELSEVESFEAFPSCSDETLSIGAYYLEAAKRFGGERLPPLEHFYLGDDLDEADTAREVEKAGFYSAKPTDMATASRPLCRADGIRGSSAREPLDPRRSAESRRRAGHQSNGEKARFLDAIRPHDYGVAPRRIHRESEAAGQP